MSNKKIKFRLDYLVYCALDSPVKGAMQSLRTIFMLLVMLAILLVNRRELTIYEEAFALHTIAHHFEGEHAHVHVVTPHQHEHETSPHQHHCHLVQDWDLAPVARDVLARVLLLLFAVVSVLAFFSIVLRIWSGVASGRCMRRCCSSLIPCTGGIGFCRPMLN